MAVKKEKSVEMQVVELSRGALTFHILGTTPFIYNAMSAKTLDSLLLGSQPKSRAEKATTVKHNPPNEYRESVYCRKADEVGPTRLIIPVHMFKACICQAALRMPGATKTEIKQLVEVEGVNADMYGNPQAIMNVMRSADMNRTPDVRTRAIVPNWAVKINVSYMQPFLNAHNIAVLFSAAGQVMGVGDSRPQKGYNFGKFEVVAEDDERYLKVISESNIKTQDSALRTPVMYDRETERLWGSYVDHMSRRDKPSAVKAAEVEAEDEDESAEAAE